MRTLLTIGGGLLGSVVGFQGMLWLTFVFHPGDNNMWPLSAVEYSLVFGLPLGTTVFGLFGYAFAIGADNRRASKPFDPHMPGEASSVNGQSASAAPRPVLLNWLVPLVVALLLATLATFPQPGIGGMAPRLLIVACWFVLPVALFLGYVVWMSSSRPSAARSKSSGKSREASAKWLLILAVGLGCLASGIAVPLAAVAWVCERQLEWGVLALLLIAAAIWIPAHIAAACLFLAGLWIQAFADRWYAGLTLWNGIYFGLWLLLLSIVSGW